MTHAILQPALGFGLGLRSQHYEEILAGEPAIDWLEILSENYMIEGGKPFYYLDRICERYPVVMHGVSLSIGGVDPLNNAYLKSLKALMQRVKPRWVSDHLCWTGRDGLNLHDLLPLPYTEEALDHVANRILQVQDFIGQRILIENVSSYITYPHSTMSEWEFLRELAQRADCLILLDINNIQVSAHNHEFNPYDYLHAMPVDRVQQIHLAGHLNLERYSIDTHDHEIVDSVWDLYAASIRHLGPVSAMIERDDHIPPLASLVDELNQARAIAANTLSLIQQQRFSHGAVCATAR